MTATCENATPNKTLFGVLVYRQPHCMRHTQRRAPQNCPKDKNANAYLFYPDYTVGFGLAPNPAAGLEQNALRALPLVGYTTDREFSRA